ncbi:MAG: sigma-70 family RNA polymerase sigma factor [Candidatus Methylomirabilia bacterium]
MGKRHLARWPFRFPDTKAQPLDVEATWRRFRATGDPKLREALVARYIHLVRYMASRVASSLPPKVETDDIISAGVVGFLAAIESFEPSRGTDFGVYALTRIRGAIVDFIRELDPVGRVTRRRLNQVERTLAALEQELSRPPTDEEAATRMGIPLENYQHLRNEAATAVTFSLDSIETDGEDEGDPVRRAKIADESFAGPLTSLMEKDDRQMLAAQVASLSPSEQLVLHLHYVEQLNFREIAMVMEVSESRATQLHSAALLHLRSRIRAGREARAASARAS